jgi:hypothetical protein
LLPRCYLEVVKTEKYSQEEINHFSQVDIEVLFILQYTVSVDYKSKSNKSHQQHNKNCDVKTRLSKDYHNNQTV